MPYTPTYFSLSLVFGEVSKLKVMFVTFCVGLVRISIIFTIRITDISVDLEFS